MFCVGCEAWSPPTTGKGGRFSEESRTWAHPTVRGQALCRLVQGLWKPGTTSTGLAHGLWDARRACNSEPIRPVNQSLHSLAHSLSGTQRTCNPESVGP